MNATDRTKFKRIRQIFSTDETEIDNGINDNQDSDPDSEYDPIVTESDDTSTNEHISEESNSSISDIQPETLEKAGVTWSIHPNPVQGRIAATNIIKTRLGPTTTPKIISDAFKLFFTSEILDERWDISRNRPLYRATMSLQRFKHLLQFIRFDNRERRDRSDRLSPVRFVFESFVKQLSRHFVPGDDFTVDEQLVPFRARCCFVQYMPKKPSKYGLKFWTLYEANCRYVLALDLYTGKKDNTVQKNLATNVVLNLVDKLPRNVQQGRSVTYDRYFTDLKLSEALLGNSLVSFQNVHERNVFNLLSKDIFERIFLK